ncbi:MAG: hypothetical protein HN817_07545 [Porticoccaceae bacterium]|jgi:uncharacterized protein YaaN involved in tellurite resistance|nr:hypothetical protein [Porticoccaceae bacterium]MBT5578303.1 hypothetical protein [Porticoccaceae bacterium]MBT7375764.1 hypothetical protein [Porticoccaceae bacterium]
MDKNRINPIIADRDDMIGRSPSSAKTDGAESNAAPSAAASSLSGGWKVLVLSAFFGLAALAGFGWVQYQDLAANHSQLQERFNLLESRLSSTDESVTQSGAAMQLNISKQGEELKKHWSEIKKLWGVTNDINKGKIAANKKDISFLASKRNELTELVDKESKSLKALSGNYLGLSAEVDAINETNRGQADGLNRLNTSLATMARDLKNNADAIQSIDAFRRQINQKIYDLEQRVAEANANAKAQESSTEINPTGSPQ